MSYSFDNDTVLAYWTDRPLVARDAFAQTAAFLRRLQAFSDVFSRLYVSNINTFRYTPLAPDFSNFDAELIAGLDPELSFSNPEPGNYSFSMSARSELGFSSSFATVPKDSQIGCWVSVKCGCFDSYPGSREKDRVDITVSPKLATPEFMRGLLEQTIEFWRPSDAAITRSKVRSLLKLPVGDATIGWLTYLADPAAAIADAVPPDMVHEPLADGILIQAAERPGNEHDADYVARLLLLRDALWPRGFLSR